MRNVSGFNLFACHKFLEKTGASILFNLATCDFHNQKHIENIKISIDTFSKILSNHANWEEKFVFKFLSEKSINSELEHHKNLEQEIKLIQDKLETDPALLSSIYLQFRKFYSMLLSHFYEEETYIMDMLREKLSEQELRRIDYDIYKSMSSDDMIEMISALFPPCNFDEKVAVLEDLKSANPIAFKQAWSSMSFTDKERVKLY